MCVFRVCGQVWREEVRNDIVVNRGAECLCIEREREQSRRKSVKRYIRRDRRLRT